MKKYLLIITIASTVLISCSPLFENVFEEGIDSQKWNLIKMTGNFVGSATTGNDMEWQESYILNKDRTFLKTRVRNKKATKVSGNFKYKTISDEKYLELTYDSYNSLIENCSSDFVELLRVTSDSTLIGSSHACDGPMLEYEKE